MLVNRAASSIVVKKIVHVSWQAPPNVRRSPARGMDGAAEVEVMVD